MSLKLLLGPCVIESEEHCFKTAAKLKEIIDLPFFFKASYDKANRTSLDSYRGPGLSEGLRILKRIRDELGLPVYTDVHTPQEAYAAAEVCEGIQIPAFLCRQTDLLVAAGETGRLVTIKKGQFMAPWDMGPAIEKVGAPERTWLIDRGTMFGYNNLVSDMRAIPIMQKFGVPVLFDGTHSVQLPGGHGSHSGGQREFVPTLCRAAIAAGADGLFLECHPNPAQAKSDAGSQLDFEMLTDLIDQVKGLKSCFAAAH